MVVGVCVDDTGDGGDVIEDDGCTVPVHAVSRANRIPALRRARRAQVPRERTLRAIT